MFSWDDLKKLHVVRQTQNILHKWWGLDVLIISAEEIKTNAFSQVQNAEFKNAFIKELFQKKMFLESFFKTLNCYHKKDYSGPFSLMEKWPGAELSLLIVPLRIHNQPTGFVCTAAFLTEGQAQDLNPIKAQWENAGLAPEWCAKNLSQIPILNSASKKYFIDLTELIAKEILSVQQELVDKSQIKHLQKNNHHLRYGNIVGHSKAMLRLYNLLEQIKGSHNTVLIQGENGTGKELIAEAIHQNSARTGRPFVVQNCSALNDNLLESELFGHVKGAFTGAYKDKPGLFETADKGTFFLDEVGDTSPAMQVKLLRVIQNGTFFPVGGVHEKKVDVRIIAATNKDLKDLTTRGKFREDLYYRLNVINIQAPPLRERTEDISLLAEFFINRLSTEPKIFTKKAMEKLLHYPWPGNVRELQNEAERLAVFAGKNTYIKEEFLSDKIKSKEDSSRLMETLNRDTGKIMKKAIAQLESRLIARSLREEGWNKTRVAKKLGISRAALVSKVKDYHLERRLLLKKQSS